LLLSFNAISIKSIRTFQTSAVSGGANHPLTLIASKMLQVTRSIQNEQGQENEVLFMIARFSQDGFENHPAKNPGAIFEIRNNGISMRGNNDEADEVRTHVHM
jgi:hypothetical protein